MEKHGLSKNKLCGTIDTEMIFVVVPLTFTVVLLEVLRKN
jgi:hypothetical protein